MPMHKDYFNKKIEIISSRTDNKDNKIMIRQ